jgi:hypothetical protein
VGAPCHGRLTGIHDPRDEKSAASTHVQTVPIHRVWFEETTSLTGLSPRGFSGAPVVVDDHVIGIVRSFLDAGTGHALGATVDITPIEAVLIPTGIPVAPRTSTRSGLDAQTEVLAIIVDAQPAPPTDLLLPTAGSGLLLDNWLLQEISHLFIDGPDLEETGLITINRLEGTHLIRQVPKAGVQIEGLINLLVDIVVRDHLVLDERYSYVWTDRASPLGRLEHEGVLVPRSIDVTTQVAKHIKQRALQELCVTDSLVQAQRRNEEDFRKHRGANTGYYSSAIWGTAGNLGRSAETKLAYSPHPIRRHFMNQTICRDPSATDQIVTWVQQERARVYARGIPGAEVRATRLLLPALAVEIIEESSSLTELIPTALQLRDKYVALRRWIRAFQDAIDDEDAHALRKNQQLLESVSQYLARSRGSDKFGDTSLSLFTGWFGHASNSVMQKFGLRSTLNRVIMTPAGSNAINKLLGMLDLNGKSLGLRAHEYLREVYRPLPVD